MLAAFSIERFSQHEDWGWTFDPKIWYWLKENKKTTNQHPAQRCLKALPKTTAPKPGFGHCPAQQSRATGNYLINNINILINNMILTIGSFSFWNWSLGFPIPSTNNLHVHGVEMQQKWLEGAGHWVQRELEKSWMCFHYRNLLQIYLIYNVL